VLDMIIFVLNKQYIRSMQNQECNCLIRYNKFCYFQKARTEVI